MKEPQDNDTSRLYDASASEEMNDPSKWEVLKLLAIMNDPAEQMTDEDWQKWYEEQKRIDDQIALERIKKEERKRFEEIVFKCIWFAKNIYKHDFSGNLISVNETPRAFGEDLSGLKEKLIAFVHKKLNLKIESRKFLDVEQNTLSIRFGATIGEKSFFIDYFLDIEQGIEDKVFTLNDLVRIQELKMWGAR